MRSDEDEELDLFIRATSDVYSNAFFFASCSFARTYKL